MNKGIYFTLPNNKVYLFKEYLDDYLQKTKEFIHIISRELEGTNIKVHIENTGIYDNDYIIQAIDIFMKFDCFHLTWDVGHDFSSDNKDSFLIEKYIYKTTHLHLHDYIGKKNHLPLGTGELELDKILSTMQNSCKSIIFETKTSKGLIESVDFF